MSSCILAAPVRRGLVTLAMMGALSGVAAAQDAATFELVLEPSADAVLIERPEGDLANATGDLFFGRTNQQQNGTRRSLLRFDVARFVPRDVQLVSVALEIQTTSGSQSASFAYLHPVRASWPEGSTFSPGGSGMPAAPGDVTWLFRSFDDQAWQSPGGDYRARPSARVQLGANGTYVFESPWMVLDVKRWIGAPNRDHGWILIGDETRPQTSRRLGSRETADPELRPRLHIVYRLPNGPRVRPGGGAVDPPRRSARSR